MEHTIAVRQWKIFENKSKWRIMKNDLTYTMYGFISLDGVI